jgi:hypothetical protein
MANTQLPAEVVTDIHTKADTYIKSSDDEGTEWGAYVAGAAEYATKLHDRDQKIELLTKARKSEAEFIDKAIALLSKFISRHEAGLLPDRFIYDEIKTFLDGK